MFVNLEVWDFDFSWLVPTNQNKATWLASFLSSHRTDHSHLSQVVFRLARLIAFLLYEYYICHVRLSVQPSFCPSFRPAVLLSVFPSSRPSVRLSVQPSLCPSFRPAVLLYVFTSSRPTVRLEYSSSTGQIFLDFILQYPRFPQDLFFRAFKNLRIRMWYTYCPNGRSSYFKEILYMKKIQISIHYIK